MTGGQFWVEVVLASFFRVCGFCREMRVKSHFMPQSITTFIMGVGIFCVFGV